MVLCDIMISKKRREDRLMYWYTLHLIALRDTDMSPVPSSMQFWNTTAKLHKPCRGANFPGCISLSGTAYSCFIVISPFVAVRNIPIWAKMVFKTDREYPKFVIQDMTVNSVCHRDYSIKTDCPCTPYIGANRIIVPDDSSGQIGRASCRERV